MLRNFFPIDHVRITNLRGRSAHLLLVSVLSVSLIAGLAVTVAEYIPGLLVAEAWQKNPAMQFAGILGGAFAVAVAVTVLRRESPLPVVPFLLIACIASVALYLISAELNESAFVNDFRRMWEYANRAVQQGDLVVGNLYQARIIPVLIPSILLFGKSQEAVQYINVAMLVVVQLIGYDLMRRFADHRAAQGFTVLFLLAPEPLYAVGAGSHDLWGLFFLAICVWLFDQLATRRSEQGSIGTLVKTVCLGAALAATIFLLDLQRTIGSIFLLAMLATLLLGWPRRPGGSRSALRLLLVIALVVVGGKVLENALDSRGYAQKAVKTYNQNRALASAGPSFSSATHYWVHAFEREFLKPIPEEQWRSFGVALVASDFVAQPLARPSNVGFRMSTTLFRLGSQYANYFGFRFERNAPGAFTLLRAYNETFAVLLALLGILALLRVKAPDEMPPAALLQLVMLSGLALSMLLFGMAYPRYLFPIWFILPQFVATHLSTRSDRGWKDVLPLPRDIARLLASLVLVFVAALAVWLLLAFFYRSEHGRVLDAWDFSAGPAPLDSADRRRLELRQTPMAREFTRRLARDDRDLGFGKLAVALEVGSIPAGDDELTASTQVCGLAGGRRALDFYLYAPYKKNDRRRSSSLQVALSAKVLRQVSLPARTIEHVRVDLPGGSDCGKLELTLAAGVSALNSPQRASRVEIYLPRLVSTSQP